MNTISWDSATTHAENNNSVARHHDIITRDIKNQTDSLVSLVVSAVAACVRRRPPNALHMWNVMWTTWHCFHAAKLLCTCYISTKRTHRNRHRERRRVRWDEGTRAAEKRVRAMRGKQMGKIVNRLLIHIINYIKNKIYEEDVEDEEICSRRETNQTTTFRSAKHNSPNRPNAMNESTWFCPKYDSVPVVAQLVPCCERESRAVSVERVHSRSRTASKRFVVRVKKFVSFQSNGVEHLNEFVVFSSTSARCLAWCEVVEVESSYAYYIVHTTSVSRTGCNYG